MATINISFMKIDPHLFQSKTEDKITSRLQNTSLVPNPKIACFSMPFMQLPHNLHVK